MPHLGPTELIIILVIVLAIFGAGKLSSLGGALGRGVKDFRAAMGDGEKNGGDGSSEPKATPREGSGQGT
jgi:sec-independent protein translocase protein TatA